MPRSIPQLTRLLVVALVTAGCVVSTEAVVTDADATFDERLLGSWVEAHSSDRAVVSRGTGSTYAIEYTSEGETVRVQARLGRLGERLVLDVRPAPAEREVPEPYRAMLLPAHVMMVMDVGGDEIRAAMLDPALMRAALEAGRVRLPWTLEHDRVVLRGTTVELRGALVAHIAHTGVGEKPAIFRRVPAR